MKCFICGKNITWSAKGHTKDFKWICPDDVNRIFDDNVASKWNIKIKATQQLSQMTSDEIKKMLSGIETAKSKEIRGILCCPYCGSENVQPLGQHHKNFSAGKAIGGAVLTGGVGAVAGFLGKNTNQTDFVCMDCGKQFKK